MRGYVYAKEMRREGREGGREEVPEEGGLRVRDPLLVSPLCPLLDLLEAFQQGKANVAVVVDPVSRGGGREGGRGPWDNLAQEEGL